MSRNKCQINNESVVDLMIFQFFAKK